MLPCNRDRHERCSGPWPAGPHLCAQAQSGFDKDPTVLSLKEDASKAVARAKEIAKELWTATEALSLSQDALYFQADSKDAAASGAAPRRREASMP